MKKKLFHYTYFTETVAPFLHQARDLGLFIYLTMMLKLEYEFFDFFLNQPKMNAKNRQSCDFNFEPDDLLVLTTRPPLHPGGRSSVYKSGHYIEQLIFEHVKKVFSSLSREVAYFNAYCAGRFKKGYENRATIEFYVNQNSKATKAGYHNLAAYEEGVARKWKVWSTRARYQPPTSCGFILTFQSTEKLPRTLIVFGMGGEEGLIFSRILRNGLWNELNIDLSEKGPSRAIMVEFEVKIPASPISLTFADEMTGKVILDTEID